MKKSMFLAIMMPVVFMVGCGKKETAQLPARAEQSAVVQPAQKEMAEDFIPTQDQYGAINSCPVMGEKVTVGKDTKAVRYKGKVYFLCCPSCLGQFKANPEKYAK